MPLYQLQIAIALAAFSVCSAGLFFVRNLGPAEGKVQLLNHVEGVEETYPDGDPFDVATPEDLLDGYPIDEAQFWAKIGMVKIFLTILLSILVVIQALCLGFGGDIAVYTLQVSIALYILGVAALSVRQQTVELHAESIWHLTSLTFLAVALMGFTAILPSENLPVIASSNDLLPSLWYTVLAIYTIAFATSVLIPRGPSLHYPPSAIYSEKIALAITNKDPDNVAGIFGASIWSFLYCSYSTKIIMLGYKAKSLEIGDLPILPADMRGASHFSRMRRVLRDLARTNAGGLIATVLLCIAAGMTYYMPPFFLSMVLSYLERDPLREHTGWGWVWVFCLFASNIAMFTLTGQLLSLDATLLSRVRIQLNTILYAKTLVRKDIASSASTSSSPDALLSTDSPDAEPDSKFSSKAQIMTLMTTDVDRVGRFIHMIFRLIGSSFLPSIDHALHLVLDVTIELVVGTIFLYKLLGVSCFFGLAVAVMCLPLNHFAGKIIVGAQDNLMKSRDERVALMNEILGGIRMLKFMAWERSFESRVMKIRGAELKYQRLNYTIEALLTGLWNATPILVTVVAFYHFAVIRGEPVTPSIAFTSIIVFNELKFALSALPETLITALQARSLISLRRIEKYLNTPEVTPVLPMARQSQTIAFQSCTVTWPQDRSPASRASSAASTPTYKFVLVDLTLRFPLGELSLICGKLGSGKTLLLLALLGEADILGGQMMCPRSPPDSLASFAGMHPSKEEWVVQGICAYVPQAAWLRNASIKDNILFKLPYDEARYNETLEACALVTDMEILEDGDESEIGERGVNLSGGQKARVSLARAVYSRASVLLLDDVLSAVDAHTAHRLYHSCLRGELMKGRTVILVSHHVQLCAPGASYVVALDNGRVQFQGTRDKFRSSGVMSGLVQSTAAEALDLKEEEAIDGLDLGRVTESNSAEASDTTSTVAETTTVNKSEKKPPRKFFEDEQRAVGRIAWSVWKTYLLASGAGWYWGLFCFIFLVAAISPVMENGWLSYWSRGDGSNSPIFYLSIYAVVVCTGLITTTVRFFVLYNGSIRASTVLYKRLLQAVLFAHIRFHDTVSRGRLLNRFGKDFQNVDSELADNFGRSMIYFISAITTVVTSSFIGGRPFVVAAIFIAFVYYQIAKIYGQASRDMRRLDSVTRSPLYSMYSETIAGVGILRSFGASSKFLRDMIRHVDTNTNPAFWTWGIQRWISIRLAALSSVMMALIALLAVLNKDISAPLAGFSLAFSNTLTNDLLLLVREFVSLEQSMVGMERIKEYSDLPQEPPEFIEPGPPDSWPEQGAIRCENLVIRYASELPNVLHNLTFEVSPGEKIGILGRTGSGKSTLALSFFRFVEVTEGRIVIDGFDIAQIGLTDLRSRLTIIPQDPTIMSGTVRSTLDVFNEYDDTDIFEALRRVHLIPSEDTPEEAVGAVNANMFRNLDSSVSEGGENFSTGEKQLLCMARAILKRSKLLVMDEATASVDYATDELIGKTIRHEFKESTILTIAHRLRTVIDYDKIMLLDQGRIVEYDRPAVLLSNPASAFYALCKATGKEEFVMLNKMAGTP
ncbi:multidrug resistance-associated ABC transporter [Mycena rebaudengoi]|nr:multidrug resistance-associated ABC transporter [Mycena rebaudengoi]